jgi:hypothetical protein
LGGVGLTTIGSGYGGGTLALGVFVGEFSVIDTGGVVVGPLHAVRNRARMNIDVKNLCMMIVSIFYVVNIKDVVPL